MADAGYGGPNATTYGGAHAATVGVETPATPDPSIERAAGYGGPNATAYGGAHPGVVGRPAERSVGSLLASADGFALVLERGGERALYAAADRPAKGLTALDITDEVNAMASWSAALPADRALFDWAFADVTIGFDGDRLFHGQLLPVSASSDDQVDVGGYGRLFELTSGGIEFSVANCAGWEAINQLYERIAEWTDGRVRGFCVEPPTGTERTVGDEGFRSSGTPMSVLKEFHSEFGCLFATDHAARSCVVESFRPGTQARSRTWRAYDDGVEVKIDPSSYHNRVVIRGAERREVDAGGDVGERYSATATAPDDEIEALTDGRIITHKPEADDDLESDSACLTRAESRLAELRGEWSVTGSLESVPVGVQPGYLYEVPEFAAAVPEEARPVRAPLVSVTHTMFPEPKTDLDFEGEGGVTELLRRAQNPALAPSGIQRRDPDRPVQGSVNAWGDAAWGVGVWGGDDAE